MSNYYQILEVSRSATDAELKKAYRKLARKYHPDVSKEAAAEDKFKQVQTAYDVLKDPEKRKFYDQFGDQWQSAKQAKDQGFDPSATGAYGFGGQAGAGVNPDDILEQIFGSGFRGGSGRRQSTRQAKGEDLQASVQVTLEQVYSGCEQTLQIAVPEVNAQGQMTQTPKALKVKIPKGITDGKKIRLSGQGAPGSNGGSNGDLYIKVSIKPHAFFTLENTDIHLNLPITPWEAALGGKVPVPTLGGTIELNIPAGSASGQKLRLKGRGLPSKTPGDQYCLLQIMTPVANTQQSKAFYQQMQEQMPFNPREKFGV